MATGEPVRHDYATGIYTGSHTHSPGEWVTSPTITITPNANKTFDNTSWREWSQVINDRVPNDTIDDIESNTTQGTVTAAQLIVLQRKLAVCVGCGADDDDIFVLCALCTQALTIYRRKMMAAMIKELQDDFADLGEVGT